MSRSISNEAEHRLEHTCTTALQPPLQAPNGRTVFGDQASFIITVTSRSSPTTSFVYFGILQNALYSSFHPITSRPVFSNSSSDLKTASSSSPSPSRTKQSTRRNELVRYAGSYLHLKGLELTAHAGFKKTVNRATVQVMMKAGMPPSLPSARPSPSY